MPNYDDTLRPPDIFGKPIGECDECGREIYEGEDVCFAYLERPLIFCSQSCAIAYFGISPGTAGDDAN
jgi:hypothetical protein